MGMGDERFGGAVREKDEYIGLDESLGDLDDVLNR
jgi:hypothetical protein